MKKPTNRKKVAADTDELRPEYDLRGKDLMRGKFFRRYKSGTNVVVLEPDVFPFFHDSKSVNRALRSVIRAKRATA